MNLYPIRLNPIYQERIWGGRNLARLFGRALPEGKKIGESWELADLEAGACSVANGPLAGRTITELTRELGPALLGRTKAMPDGRFPLLLKYLDAEDILSLQVHPDAEAARRIGGGAALKTECWFVLESRGGFLYKGLREGVTRDEFLKAVREDRAEPLLQRFDVKAGDFHYLPAGTVHALGAGVVVAEIQTPSDTTYRVSDWGRGRQTHLDQAMQCIHFGAAPPEPPRFGQSTSAATQGHGPGRVLVATDYFTVTIHEGSRDDPLSFGDGPGECSVLMLLKGSATLAFPFRGAGDVDPLPELKAGDTVLLPAALEFADVEPHEPVRILRVALPT